MIEGIATRIASAQIRRPQIFLIAFLAIGALLFPGIFNLVDNVEPSLEKVLPQDIEEVKTMNDMRSQFGADMVYVVLYADGSISDIRDPNVLQYVDLLEQKFRTSDGILAVSSFADEVLYLNGGEFPDNYRDVVALSISNNFVSEDFSVGVIQIKSDTGASAERVSEVLGYLNDDIESLEDFNPGLRVEVTGFNAIDKATFEIIMKDFLVIGIVSMILVMIVVILTFGSLPKAMMPMVVVINAILWTMGIAGYLGLTITVVSMVSVAMIMGLGIDFGIHVTHTYFENRKKHSSGVSLKETLSELLRAMIGASLSTMAGFLALLFGVLPAMKTLAIILALGIFNTLIGAVFLLPVLVYLYDRKFNKDVEAV